MKIRLPTSKPKKPNHSLRKLGLLFAATGIFTFLTLGILDLEEGILAGKMTLGVNTDITPSYLLVLVNQSRENQGLPPLAVNPYLTQAAELKAQDMLAKGYFSHESPENTSAWYFIELSGYSYSHAGENLARDFSEGQALVDAWLNSEPHRQNIMSSDYRETGLAVVEGQTSEGKPTILVVQLFGTPLSAGLMVEKQTSTPLLAPLKLDSVSVLLVNLAASLVLAAVLTAAVLILQKPLKHKGFA